MRLPATRPHRPFQCRKFAAAALLYHAPLMPAQQMLAFVFITQPTAR